SARNAAMESMTTRRAATIEPSDIPRIMPTGSDTFWVDTDAPRKKIS
ncbi:MAG: hypothetical protein QOG96_1833, partial [Pseudonocardiales bacterium]|nr:hypothetical protein [Pseudonocardiales bacterium]